MINSAPDIRLTLHGVSKRYAALQANDNIDLTVRVGEIHAILGENGAGKSTLMKIIYGLIRPDSGSITWEGETLTIDNPAVAKRCGIGMVFQHFSLFETLTVADNIAVAIPDRHNRKQLVERLRTVSEHYKMPLNPQRLVHSLSMGERQRVEIVRCLLQNPRLLILDEPTSVLPQESIEQLFNTLRQLADEGCSVLYISHKLDEIRELCHRATILRAGKVISCVDPRDYSNSDLAQLMIGRQIAKCQHLPITVKQAVNLRINRLSQPTAEAFGTDLKDIQLELHANEIVGIAGVAGNGQRELLRVISGEWPLAKAQRSTIEMDGKAVGDLGCAKRRDLGLGYIPEERLNQGTVATLSLEQNTLLTAHRQRSEMIPPMVRYGLIQRLATQSYTERCIRDFDVRCDGVGALAHSLSGGNIQKFIVGREILQEPKVLIAAWPTWGVDIVAATAIRQALIDLRNRGAAILVVSEDLDDLFEISDRIHVLAEGYLSPPLAKGDGQHNKEQIGLWMGGALKGEKQAHSPVALDA